MRRGRTHIESKVRINVPRQFDPALLDDLAAHAAARGVYRVNLTEAVPQLKYVRTTCRSMTIPTAALDFVVDNCLPIRLLEQPEFLLPGVEERIFGRGIIIALRSVAIGPKVNFYTEPGKPIILREYSTVTGPLKIAAGTVVEPGARLG